MMTMARYLLLFFSRVTGQLVPLLERANYTAIGILGHVSPFDEDVAKKRGLKPLNRFEQWLLKSIIGSEQKRRREAFRQATIKVTGEDPDTDWDHWS
jgi:hypothetical protein